MNSKQKMIYDAAVRIFAAVETSCGDSDALDYTTVKEFSVSTAISIFEKVESEVESDYWDMD